MPQTVYIEMVNLAYALPQSVRPKNSLETTMNNEKDLIEQARQAGQAYIGSFKGDDQAMLKDLDRRAKASGRRVVHLPPKKVVRKTANASS